MKKIIDYVTYRLMVLSVSLAIFTILIVSSIGWYFLYGRLLK